MPVLVPSNVVVAPSGFKESLDGEAVARAIAAGVRRCLPGASVISVPIVDGGEGSAATLATATGGRLVPKRVTGPVGQPVDAHVAMLGGVHTGTAVIDMASAAGLRLVPHDQRDPGLTTTYGVGELLLAALDEGAHRVVVGCGDSGTSDGGAGMVSALGGRLLDAEDEPLPPGGSALHQLARLDLTGIDQRILGVRIDVACNTHNVLTGERGVARVFGPQKGATPDQVEHLSNALEVWAQALETTCRPTLDRLALNIWTGPGTGASGGLGAALAAVCGAHLRPRFEVLLDPEPARPGMPVGEAGLAGVNLDRVIANADLVITAEGAVDYQTPRGKVPAEVATRAKRYGKPVIALAGSIGSGAADVHDVGIDAVVGIIPIPMELAQAVDRAEELVADAVERSLRLFLLGIGFGAAHSDPALARI